MSQTVEFDGLIIGFISVSILVSLLMTLVLCICRLKPKSNSSLNNANNLLPLNSIRSTDLSNNLELIRYNGNSGSNVISIEESDNHLRHTKQMTLNRALPDIPSVMSSSTHSTENEFELSSDNNQPNELQSSRRSSKARAPQPPINRFAGSGQVLTSPGVSDIHHPYARIKDIAIADSSTENDTDDYCDPQLCTASNSNQFLVRNNTDCTDENDVSPPVPAKRFGSSEVNGDPGFSASNAIANRVSSEEIPYMTPPPVRLSNIDPLSQSSTEESRANAAKNEISYNTISVREPLAKVLAERANSEHHYNEVEEERVSSFYEEIAGSTASSVTYSKIGDVVLTNNNVAQASNEEQQDNSIDNEPPALPSLESLMQMRAESSSSVSPQQSLTSSDHVSDATLISNYPKDLYSSVDKKSKTKAYNRQTIHCVPESDNQFENLYAKVQKPSHNVAKEDMVVSNQRPSSASEDRCDSVFSDSHLSKLSDNSIPPPLPPPLNKCFHPRTSRTISMYDSSNIVPNSTTSSHQRRYSSGNQSIIPNSEWRKEQNDDYFKYETVRNNDIDLETDPGYEVIKKKTETNSFRTQPEVNTTSLQNGFQPSVSVVDPGYEAIGYDESDFDPAYETISKKTVTSNVIEIVEPGYEVIKRVPRTHPSHHFDHNITRNVSDLSSEPGYERIRFTIKTDEEIESEPNYASISRTVDLYEDDEEDELTERL